jgi:DNA-binding NarL/FixJ family response regulator
MPQIKKSRILIVDDHPAMREGLRAILHTAKDLIVCGEAQNSQEALIAIQTLQPDLAIVDISLREDRDGFDLTRKLREQWPTLPVLAFSLHEERAYSDAALAAGATGYCAKGESSKTLINAVRQVIRGKTFVSKLVGQ